MIKRIFFLTFIPLLVLCTQADAAQMAIWTFGPDAENFTTDPAANNVVGAPTLLAGGGDYDDNGKDGTGYTDSLSVYHAPGQALAWNDPTQAGDNDGGIIITINTTGFYDLNIRWDYWSENSGSNVGPNSLDFDYSIDNGLNWIEVLNNEPITRNEDWNPFELNLSSIAVIENRSSVQFKINDFDDKFYGVGADFLIDNIEITGVPEPATFALMVTGASYIFMRKKRKV